MAVQVTRVSIRNRKGENAETHRECSVKTGVGTRIYKPRSPTSSQERSIGQICLQSLQKKPSLPN